jgi:hypothetical protein
MINYDIANAIKNHADKEGSGYCHWYCGIATDPDKRLFYDHNVPEKGAWWIKRNAQTESDARDTEDYLLKEGFDGDVGGGDSDTIYVYAYKKIQGATLE